MKLHLLSLIAIPFLSSLTAAQTINVKNATNPEQGFGTVLTDTEAIMMLPPKLACAESVASFSWSSDGQFILFSQSDLGLTAKAMTDVLSRKNVLPSPTFTLSLYDVKKGESRVLAKLPSGAFPTAMVWLPKTHQAYATVIQIEFDQSTGTQVSQSSVYSISPTAKTIDRVLVGAQEEYIEVYVSPLEPRAFSIVTGFWKGPTSAPAGGAPSNQPVGPPRRVNALGADGRLGPTYRIEDQLSLSQIEWSADGRLPILLKAEMQNGKRNQKPFALDLDSGRQYELASVDLYKEPTKIPDLRVEMREIVDTAVTPSPKTIGTYLVCKSTEEKKEARVAADAVGTMSPAADGVLYIQSGAAFYRPLFRMSKEVYLEAQREALRAQLISETKQCAIGFLIYAADNDDVLMSPGSDWMSAITPYLKNDQMMSGFIYTFGGGDMSKIEDPAGTVLGYKLGPGGRAVAYTDGHVKWIPDK